MRLPLSLIKSFLPLDVPVEKICDALTLLGIEVDSCLNEHPPFARVIVGEILSVSPHPSAEKLQIAHVHDGKHSIQVVCGASNCRAGIKTAFAQVGALLIDKDGKQRTIEKASLRGVESNGMLCSGSELRIWNDDSGILELPHNWKNGTDLSLLLWDPILELSLTPNLGHCLSALGIARELSAAFKKPIHQIRTPFSENSHSSIHKKVKVTIHESKFCPRYMCRLIEGITVGPSPFWLQKELLSCGLKPICNIVDATNFIMLKFGQPLHAFDFDQLEGKTIEVVSSKTVQNFLGLDGINREIPPETLLICDAKKTVAIAGVLGGENSAVHENTKNILLEAAFFDPMAVRKGAKRLGLRTESAVRFEKGVDPNGIETALDEAAKLIAEISAGQIATGKIDIQAKEFLPLQILCRPERVNHLLGTTLSKTEIETIFHRLHFKTQLQEGNTLLVEIPTYRFDISEEIDLIEEIVRIYGYNSIAKEPPLCRASQIPHDPIYLFEKKLRTRCVSLGLQEFLTSDLISPKLTEIASEFTATKGISLLKAIHAKTEEYSCLRPSLLPGLLEIAKGNLDQKNLTFSAFEIGRIHFLQKEKSIEIPMISVVLAGKTTPPHWSTKGEDSDFYTLKGLLENLFEGVRIAEISFSPSKHLSFHPGRQSDIRYKNILIGSFGEVHPRILNKMDIKQRIYFAEIDIQHLLNLHQPSARFTAIPHLPASERDVTLQISTETHIESVFEKIRSAHLALLEKIELIDLYQPENMSHKNATFRFTYRDLLKTISNEEVEKEHTRLLNILAK